MFLLFTLLVLALNCGQIHSQLVIYITENNGTFESNSPNFVIDCTKNYYFITHGWAAVHFDHWLMDNINKLNSNPDNLAYMVDWVDLADVPQLEYVAIDVPSIAQIFATDTLLPLYQQCKTPFVYMMSISLGCHMLGLAGRHLQTLGYTPDVIMALDPAGPFLVALNKGGPIKPGDAKQVVVAHTSDLVGGTVFVKGKTNFYFNGGVMQPGCGIFESCSHGRGVSYFNESLSNPNGFVAHPCFVLLGLVGFSGIGSPLNFNAEIPLSAKGDYCLNTNAQEPFAQGGQEPGTTIAPDSDPQEPGTTITPDSGTTTSPITPTTSTIPTTEEEDEYYWDINGNPQIVPFYCNI